MINNDVNETNKLKEIESYFSKKIPLNNDAFNFFAMNRDFCEEFLRILLQDDKLIVIENDIQKLLHNLTSKDVYLDMLCKLSDNRLVNVEIQLYEDKDDAKRILYYASKLLDTTTKKGTKYEEINDIINLFNKERYI